MENIRKEQKNINIDTEDSSSTSKDHYLLLYYKNISKNLECQYFSEEKYKDAWEILECYRSLPMRGTNIDIKQYQSIQNKIQKTSLFAGLSKKNIYQSVSDKIKDDIGCWNSLGSLKNSYFNKIPFFRIKKLLEMDLSKDLKDKLYQFIIWSRDSEEINVASSNSIAVLKKSGFLFTNKDFSNVKIPKADLSNYAFINTNFENSDLSQANFSRSNFYSSKFSNANLNQADFGWKVQLDTRCSVKAVAYSRCGKFLASNTNIKNITIWQSKDNWEKAAELIGHTHEVTSLSFSPCSKYLISGSRDSTIKKWSLSTFNLLHDFKWHTKEVRSVNFSPNGEYIASSGKDLLIIIWNVTKDQIESSIQLENAKIKSLSWSPYSNLLGFTNISPKITIWDISAKRSLWEINKQKKIYKHPNKKGSRAIAFSPCGKYLAWSGKKNRIQLWKINSQERLRVFQSFAGCLCFSLDGKKIISWNTEFSIKLWKIKDSENYGSISRQNWATVRSISQSPCGKYIASGGSDWKLVVSSLKKQKLVNGHTHGMLFVTLSNCGKFLSSVDNRSLMIWDFTTYKLIKKIRIWNCQVTSISFSHDSNIIAYCGWKTPIILIFLNQNFSQKHLENSKHSILISFAPQSNLLLSSRQNKIDLWDADNRIWLKEIGRHKDQIMCIVWSPKSEFNGFASSSSDLSIKLWRDLSNSVSLLGLTDIDNALAFSPCGKYLASGGLDWVLKIWDVGAGKLLYSVYFFYNPISSISWSRFGRYMAIGFSQKFIYLWDFKEEKIISIFHSHKSEIKNVYFSNCEDYLVSSGNDGTIKVWNISTLIEKTKQSLQLQKKAIFINREEIIGLDEGWAHLEWSSVVHDFNNSDSLLRTSNVNMPV